MKTTSPLFLKLFLLCSLIYIGDCYSQSIVVGKWTAKCIVEKIDQSSFSFDSFCQYSKLDGSSMKISDRELTLTNQELTYSTEAGNSTVSYSFDEEINVLKFKYNDREFVYSVLIINDTENIILKETEGTLIYLEKNK